MTAEEFRAIRLRAGLSAQKLADLVRLGDGSAVRKIEAGTSGINGPLSLLMELLDAGVLPRE